MENPQQGIKARLNLTDPWKCIMFYSNHKTQQSYDESLYFTLSESSRRRISLYRKADRQIEGNESSAE